ISHYVVILCDGVPTYTPLFMLKTHSIDPADTSMYAFYDFGGNYYTQDKNGNPRTYVMGGNTYFFRDVHLATYHNYDNVNTDDVNDIIQSFEGRSIKHYGTKLKNTGVKKTFVIGFSKVKKDNGGVDYIAECCGIERSDFPKQVIKFSDENVDDLNKVFVDIKNIIMQDFWLIKGPEL
ncbi:MAG: hypothetical protein Q4A41_00645, partial [Bacillota bacterium]|nr:hypothetical protein [Bacillota bacterium]